MKTSIAACSLILTAGGALAQDSIYGDFAVGNPDLGYDVDMSLPVIGSPEAYAMAAQGCGKPTAIVC